MGIIDAFLYLITRWEFVAVVVGLLLLLPVVFSLASMDKKPVKKPGTGPHRTASRSSRGGKSAPAADTEKADEEEKTEEPAVEEDDDDEIDRRDDE